MGRITTMNAVNAVLLFFLVWTFSAVCQAYDDCSGSCDDVTGTVGNEVTFTCNISRQCSECCIMMYKFQYPDIFNNPTICKKEYPVYTCEQRTSFTCRYTPTKAMTGVFSFFVQAKCGIIKNSIFTVFTVLTETPIPEKQDTESTDTESKGTGSKDTVISSVVGCSVIVILIIILITIIYKKQSFGFQRRMCLCVRHNDDNSNCPENVIL